MVSAANFLLEESRNPASDSFKAMVKSGMMPDPNKNPQHTKAWLETMQGMKITNNNLITIQKDWADLTDNDPKNDYEFRPLDTVWDYRTGKYSGDKYGSALGEAGKQLSVQLEQLDDDEPFVRFEGTTASDQTKSLSTDTSVGALTGHIRVSINGTDFWIPYYAIN